jgi:hypothetical protein
MEKSQPAILQRKDDIHDSHASQKNRHGNLCAEKTVPLYQS